MGYNCLFTDVGVTIFRRSDDSIAFKRVLEGQLYLVDFNKNTDGLNTCFIAARIDGIEQFLLLERNAHNIDGLKPLFYFLFFPTDTTGPVCSVRRNRAGVPQKAIGRREGHRR